MGDRSGGEGWGRSGEEEGWLGRCRRVGDEGVGEEEGCGMRSGGGGGGRGIGEEDGWGGGGGGVTKEGWGGGVGGGG